MTHSAAIRMLKTVTILAAAFGLAMILALATPLGTALSLFIDLAFLPVDGAQALTPGAAALMTAISGGLMCGFCVLIYLVTEHIYSTNPALGRRLLIPALLAWYVPDSLGSLAAGAWFNVVMNTLFLLLFLVPLMLARPAAAQTA
ncbi:excinuclease ABC subunit A [Leisingera sp. NJS204]|uniref:excinuclease ABC subunit A n=1 Tax=Leisingera sp. NJS204 TaxID=2508307 RepID=UPI001012BF96|nr:excinuclease ABC subunit A [Leisingera sp. NJS204]QAX29730.1 excinuclease ABC subunit A [Leisingera sp. NJS204]